MGKQLAFQKNRRFHHGRFFGRHGMDLLALDASPEHKKECLLRFIPSCLPFTMTFDGWFFSRRS